MQKYINAIRENICSICADSSETGDCLLSNDEFCAIEVHLNKIIEIVLNNPVAEESDLFNLLKDEICKNCAPKNSKGQCVVKADSNCTLDKYFAVIIRTIRKLQQ